MRVDINHLKKSYNSKIVLDIKNISIKPGINIIFGENGCGKTTLLQILANITTYDEGQIQYNGEPYNSLHSKEITLIRQKPYMLDRTVYDNVHYPLKIRGVGRSESHSMVDQILQQFNIPHLKEKKALKLSGGETQKVALARAMVFNPKLLMLDESTSNIDKKSISSIERYIKSYAGRGHSVVFVTHDQKQAMRLADNFIEL